MNMMINFPGIIRLYNVALKMQVHTKLSPESAFNFQGTYTNLLLQYFSTLEKQKYEKR